MAALEVFEDVKDRVSTFPVITLTKSYIPNSVNLFINGLLQTTDSFTETDPSHGKVTVTNDTFVVSPNNDHNLVVSYLTEELVIVNPYAPVHISKLKVGDVVRVAMKAGMHLNPVPPVRKGEPPGLESSTRNRSAQNFSITVLLGWVTNNDSRNGILTVQTDQRSRSSSQLFNAVIQYSHIKIIRKYVTPTRKLTRNVPVSAASNAYRRPGALARGVLDSKGMMDLVKVFF